MLKQGMSEEKAAVFISTLTFPKKKHHNKHFYGQASGHQNLTSPLNSALQRPGLGATLALKDKQVEQVCYQGATP